MPICYTECDEEPLRATECWSQYPPVLMCGRYILSLSLVTLHKFGIAPSAYLTT
jgi:hypothetical protein